ncbi:MAG: HAD family hydrolase [Clostridia bacterium]|nr:HAD family hydrolase [Clostridia bacterium]
MYKYAIFDLDGTLANTLEDLANAMNYALSVEGMDTHPKDAYRNMVGSGIINFIKKASNQDSSDIILSIKKHFEQYYGEHFKDTTCEYEGTGKMLKNLKERGVATAVLSNKPDAFVGDILSSLYPDIVFEAKWGKKEEFPVKPNPESLFAIMEEIGADKESTVYIGDSDVDVFTAKNGGIDFIGCSWGFRGEQELCSAGAELIAHSNSELERLIIGE